MNQIAGMRPFNKYARFTWRRKILLVDNQMQLVTLIMES